MTKTQRIVFRICIDTSYIVAALVLPWWATLFLTPALILFFNSYYEALYVGFILDIVYGSNTSLFFGFTFLCTLYAAALIIGFFFLKKRLTFNSLR